MRTFAIIAIVGALGLTGCTTMGLERSGDHWYSGFPPTYKDGKSEYKPSPQDEDSKGVVYSEKPSKLSYRTVEVIPEPVKKALASELKGLRKEDLAFIAIIGTNGSVRMLKGNTKKSNQLTTQSVRVKTIKPITVMTYTGSHCVAVVYKVTIEGDYYEEYCAEWGFHE